MEKVIRDGMVAVLYSPGFGGGWSTWNKEELEDILLFHPDIVKLVEENRLDEIDKDFLTRLTNNDSVWDGGAHQLEIEWLPIGTRFMVDEYDGSEVIRLIDEISHTA
jgi:hypothetical protein